MKIRSLAAASVLLAGLFLSRGTVSAQIIGADDGGDALVGQGEALEPTAPVEPLVNVMNCGLRYGPNPSPRARRCTAKLLMGDGSLRIISCLIAAGTPACVAQAPMPPGVRILRVVPASLSGPGEEENGCMYMTDSPLAMVAPASPGVPPVNVMHQFMCAPRPPA